MGFILALGIDVQESKVLEGRSAPFSILDVENALNMLAAWESENVHSSFTDFPSEWVKGLLAVPFVLHSQPTGVFETRSHTVKQMAELAHRRYAEIMLDVERMIDDHSKLSFSFSPFWTPFQFLNIFQLHISKSVSKANQNSNSSFPASGHSSHASHSQTHSDIKTGNDSSHHGVLFRLLSTISG